MSEHIRKGYSERFSMGLPTGDIPFGYRPGESTRSAPVAVPAEADAIKTAFHDYAQGKGFLAIATEWNRRGLKPRSKRGLDKFTVSSVQSVLENRFYCGFISHLGQERPGAHQPIITEG